MTGILEFSCKKCCQFIVGFLEPKSPAVGTTQHGFTTWPRKLRLRGGLVQFVASISGETSRSCCQPNRESHVFGTAHLAGIGRAGGLDRRSLQLKATEAPHLPASFMWSPVPNLTQLCTETASHEIAREWGERKNRLVGKVSIDPIRISAHHVPSGGPPHSVWQGFVPSISSSRAAGSVQASVASRSPQ